MTTTDTATTDLFTRENSESAPEEVKDLLPLTSEARALLAHDNGDETDEADEAHDGDAQYYFRGIQVSWHKTVQGNMKTARWCAQADRRRVRKEVLELLTKHRVMTEPTFSKLVQIGNDKRLQAIEHLLPPHYSTIYEVTQLKTDEDRDELKEAVKDGKISRSLQRGELPAWLEEKGYRKPGAPRPSSASLPEAFFAAIRLMAPSYSADELDGLNSTLTQIARDFEAEIVRPRNRYTEKMCRWQEGVLDHVRKSARALVREHLKGKKGSFKKPPFVKGGLHQDEIDIPDDADRERIVKVLALIGRDDEFNRLWKTAERDVPQPKCPKSIANAPAPEPSEVEAQLDVVAEQIEERSRQEQARAANLRRLREAASRRAEENEGA